MKHGLVYWCEVFAREYEGEEKEINLFGLENMQLKENACESLLEREN